MKFNTDADVFLVVLSSLHISYKCFCCLQWTEDVILHVISELIFESTEHTLHMIKPNVSQTIVRLPELEREPSGSETRRPYKNILYSCSIISRFALRHYIFLNESFPHFPNGIFGRYIIRYTYIISTVDFLSNCIMMVHTWKLI